MESRKCLSDTHSSAQKIKLLYDSKEAAEILGISVATLRRAIKLKQINIIYIGKYLKIPAEEINKLAKSKLLSVKDASSILQIGKTLVRKLIKQGKLKAVRFAKNGPFKISLEDIERTIQNNIDIFK